MKHSTPHALPDRHSPDGLRRWLEGVWALDRETEDRLSNQRYTLRGECRFAPRDNGLIQQETGVLVLENRQEFPASQSYLWRFNAEHIWLHFMDERPFIQLSPPFKQNDSFHLCGQDEYSARFDFSAMSHWACTWHVEGPRKNYVMTSRYQRYNHGTPQ